ncbi:MAG TPA: MFS transporter [Casimicrobiaceae bacterium]|nr:MFS transporter [Casimicrobiaceae bacterium]
MSGARVRLRREGLWRHRDFLLLWSAQGVSAVGSRVTRTALPMAAILVAGAGALDLGLLAAALTLPRALFAWSGGGFVDRHRRRPVLIGADVVRAVALAAIPAAAWWGALSLPLLYAVAAITGVATVLFELADHVLITDLVGREQLLEANGKREAVDAVAEITGPALGGALVAWLTAPIAIAADAASFVASALLIARIRKRETIAAPPAGGTLVADVRTGIHVVWRDPAIRALFVAAATMTLFGSFMAALYTLFALGTLGLTPAQIGITIGCGGIGALVGASFAGRAAVRFGPRTTLLWTLGVGAAMQALIPLAPPVPWIAMSFLIATQVIGDGVLTVYLVNETTLRQRLLPPEALGRAAATFHVANGTLTPIGALIGGTLAEGIGLRPTLWLLAIGYALAFLALLAARRALPARATPPRVLDPSKATG